MRWIVYGAGAIGGTIGARLHKANQNVVLIARGEHAKKIASDGLRFIHPQGNEFLDIPVVNHPDKLTVADGDVILLCMKTQHTATALADLCSLGLQDVPIVCVQNGVANERLAARLCSHVYTSVVNLPAMHLLPGVVATYAGTLDTAGGVLDSGCYPTGVDDVVEQICAGLRKAGFAATADAAVMAKKYSKLLSNLSNALELLLVQRDGVQEDFRDAGRVLRTEALACYAAAQINFVPLREYVKRNSELYTTVGLSDAPRTGGSTLQSLQRGAAEVETDYLNGEIALLGRMHGVATPYNMLVQKLARDVVEGRREKCSMRWSEISAAVESDAGKFR